MFIYVATTVLCVGRSQFYALGDRVVCVYWQRWPARVASDSSKEALGSETELWLQRGSILADAPRVRNQRKSAELGSSGLYGLGHDHNSTLLFWISNIVECVRMFSRIFEIVYMCSRVFGCYRVFLFGRHGGP